MDDEPLKGKGDFFVKIGTKLIPGNIEKINYSINVNSGEHQPAETLRKNEIAVCELSLAQSVVLDTFAKHKTLGELLLIDRLSNATSACGVIEQAKQEEKTELEEVTPAVRAEKLHQIPYVVLTKNEEESKQLEKQLILFGKHTMRLRGEEASSQVIKLLQEAGLIVLVPEGAEVSGVDTEFVIDSQNVEQIYLG
jgi:sulfate adenylyltransferase subunit 1